MPDLGPPARLATRHVLGRPRVATWLRLEVTVASLGPLSAQVLSGLRSNAQTADFGAYGAFKLNWRRAFSAPGHTGATMNVAARCVPEFKMGGAVDRALAGDGDLDDAHNATGPLWAELLREVRAHGVVTVHGLGVFTVSPLSGNLVWRADSTLRDALADLAPPS